MNVETRNNLTPHQKRVLAALRLLTSYFGRKWWMRQSIGQIVKAGGYHAVIQRSTMRKLKSIGLVMIERDSWSKDVKQLVRCSCAGYHWGLTAYGATLSDSIPVAWPEDIDHRLQNANDYAEHQHSWRDDHKPPDVPDDDDDDDGGGGDGSPQSPHQPSHAPTL